MDEQDLNRFECVEIAGLKDGKICDPNEPGVGVCFLMAAKSFEYGYMRFYIYSCDNDDDYKISRISMVYYSVLPAIYHYASLMWYDHQNWKLPGIRLELRPETENFPIPDSIKSGIKECADYYCKVRAWRA